jgi:uncharacterized protein
MSEACSVYQFSWSHLGDIEMARPNIGAELPVAVYRLMEYTMRHVLSSRYGNEETRQILREAGRLAGEQFCLHILDTSLAFPEFVAQLQQKCKELCIGILRVEEAEFETLDMVITVSEDLDCSGLPVMGVTVCDYDEGFIAGILKTYTGKDLLVREIDCWATGERTCRFEIHPL